jgi:hypothetical protein
MIQPDAREKLRWALRVALANPKRNGGHSWDLEGLWPEINPPRQKLDKAGEPVAHREREEGRLRPDPITTPDGISEGTRQNMIYMGLQETDPFPTKTTLRKVLAVYKAKPIIKGSGRDEVIRIIEAAIEWTRKRRTKHQMGMDQMNLDTVGAGSRHVDHLLDSTAKRQKQKKERVW